MSSSFPRPYINDVKEDTSIMHYVRDGDFANTDIGSRKSGTPGAIKSERMNIEHVSNNSIGGPNWGGK